MNFDTSPLAGLACASKMFAYANLLITCELASMLWEGYVEVLHQETFGVASVLTSLYSFAQRGPVISERPFPIPYQECGAARHGSRPCSPPVASRRTRSILGRMVPRYPLGCRRSSKRNTHRAGFAVRTDCTPNHSCQLDLRLYERRQGHARTDGGLHRAGRQNQAEAGSRTSFQVEFERERRTVGANLREGGSLICATENPHFAYWHLGSHDLGHARHDL
jgi:hypothetical protein